MKQNKKYALRKTAAYGLVSCAVGLMLVGSVPIQADESASSTDAISTVEDTQDTSRITDVLKGQVQGYIQASKSLTGDDFIVDADVAPDKLPAIEHYKTIFNQIPASYRRLVTSVQFIHAEDAILGDTSSLRAIKIRANYIHPDQTPDFSDGLSVMFHELGHVIDFASIQGEGDSLWSISRDPYMRNLLEKTYPNNVKYVYESFADAFGSWLKYRVLGESDSNMQDLYNQFDSLFGDFIFNSPYNNDDNVTERTYKESTVFNWTGTFKSDKGEQLHDDAHLSAFYERVIHEANNNQTADQWTLVNRTSDHMEDLYLENHRFFGYGEPNTQSVGGNVFTVPGRIGDYYLASYDGNKMSHFGTNLWFTWQDHIYNTIGKQGATAGGVTNFVYRQKDTKITLRLIDSEHPEKVYHTIEVPAFTNYEHNGLDTHVFDSFKSEGELLDNLPNEVALENDGKTIDIRLKKNEEFTTTVKVKNEKGDVLKEVQVTGKHDSTNRIDYGDLSEINKEYDTSKLPDTLLINKDQSVVEYVVPSRKNASVNVVIKNSSGDVLETFSYEGKVGDTVHFDNITNVYLRYWKWAEPITDVPEPIVLKETNEDIVVVLKDQTRKYLDNNVMKPNVRVIGMTDHFVLTKTSEGYQPEPSTDKPEGTFYPIMDGIMDIKNDYLVNGARFYVWAADKENLEFMMDLDQMMLFNGGDLSVEDLRYGEPKTYNIADGLSIFYDESLRTHEKTFKDFAIDGPRTKIELPMLEDYDLYYQPRWANSSFFYFSEDSNAFDEFVKIEKPLSFWNRPSDEKIQAVLNAHKNEKFASYDDMVDALIKPMYTEDEIGLSEDLIHRMFYNRPSNAMPFAYIPSKHTIHAKIVNERGEVLKDVPVTGRGNDEVDISWGSLSGLEKLYDLSDIPTTHHIPLHGAQDITLVVKDKEDAYAVNWKVYDEYGSGSNLIHQGTVTGKYGEKLSDKLDLSQYHLDEFSKNRLNRYRFGVDSLTGSTLQQTVDYRFYAPTDIKKYNVYIQYVDDKGDVVYPTKRLTLEEGQTLRDYVIPSDSLLGEPTPRDNQFNLGDILDGDDDFTLSNKEDVLNYTVNASGDQIVKVIYDRKEVNSQATFKDALGREIHQTIDYRGKLYDKLSEETVEQIRQVLIENKENHPDVLITLGSGKQYTDIDTFLNDLPSLRFGNGASRIKVQYGVTIMKTYPFRVQSSFARILVPDDLDTFARRFCDDNWYSPTDGKLYDVFAPFVVDEHTWTSYEKGKLFAFVESVSSMGGEHFFGDMAHLGVDVSSVPVNPKVTATYPLTLTMQIDPSGKVAVSNVEMGEIESDVPLSLRLPGFDTYYIPDGDSFGSLVNSIYNHEVDSDSFKFDDTFNYQLGAQLSSEDITKLMSAFEDMGGLDENNTESLDEKINDILDSYQDRVGITLPHSVKTVTGEEAKELFDGKYSVSPLLLVTPKTYHNKVKVVNEDGDVLLEKDLSTKYKDTVRYDMTDDLRTIENEYVTMDVTSGSWTANTENQEIVIHAKKRFVLKTETKQVKRIVRFHDGKQVVGEEEQVVTFTRTVTTDRKTDEVTYSDWESEHPQFDALNIAEKEDKTSNVQSVPEKAVTAEDKDEIVDVYYGPKMVDGGTQTKASIHVVYRNQDGTVYKEFDVQADKGTVLDGSDLEMLPDDMNFTDDFLFYEVKGDGTDAIERTVKKQTSDSGTQTDTPDSKDNGTQTDNPDTSDGSTQTKAEIKVVYKNADGTVYKEFVVDADKGAILDASDLEMLPDNMEFNDDFMFYEVKGDGTDNIERVVKKLTSDQGSQTYNPDTSDGSTQTDNPDSKDDGTQTDNPDTSDGSTQTDTPDIKDDGTQTDNPDTSDTGTQTKAEIKVVYKNADGMVYKEFVVNADKGTILDASDLEMLPDDMEFNDDFMFYEVKGDGSDAIERIVKKLTSDQGSQTDNPDTSDGSTQTDEPDIKDDDTDKPATNDQGTQTDKPSDKPDESNGSTQTKPDNKPVVQDVTIKVVYVDENGQTIQSFEVTKQVGSSIVLKDMQDLDDSYVFIDFDKDVKGFVVDKDTTLTLHVKKMQQVDNGIEPSDSTPQKDRVKADAKIDNVKKVSVGTNQLPKSLVKEAKLPKAGSEDAAKVGIIGATMALLSGLIGIISRRKVHK